MASMNGAMIGGRCTAAPPTPTRPARPRTNPTACARHGALPFVRNPPTLITLTHRLHHRRQIRIEKSSS